MAAPDLHPIEASHLHARRERVFLIFAGIFLGSLTMLNILGITRFIDLSFNVFGFEIPFVVAVGVLPYPVTFLCTDFVSEFYGRKRANFLVFVGLLLNLWVIFILWLGGVLPPQPVDESKELFFQIKGLAFGAVAASMVAYLAAQFCDVYLFHFWKKLTRGRHLWLRNNGSTLVSQLIDATAVISITYYVAGENNVLRLDLEQSVWPQLMALIAANYVFKMVAALLDTIPFYIGAHYLAGYLQIDPRCEHDAGSEESGIRTESDAHSDP